MSEAKEARFQAFVAATDQEERDRIAFLEFERAAHRVADRACMVNQYSDPAHNVRELETLEAPATEMLLRALPRVGLGPLLANAESIGVAIRFGLIDAKPQGLDAIADADALNVLVEKAEQADEAHLEMVQREQEKAIAGGRPNAGMVKGK